jgi:hypothetical protein
VFDTLFSWLACISVNAAFHTHLGTFTLFWIIVVANFWLSANVTAIIKNSN